MSDTEGAGQPAERPLRLARILESYRRRDWIGVSIELVVVVAGILIAFQVDQWGDERERAKNERQFLERLYREYGRAAEELQGLEEEHRKVMGDVRLAMAARGDPERLDVYARMDEMGCGMGRFRDAPFNDTSYGELVSSGRINIVSDRNLRDEIRDLAAAQAASAKQIDTSRMLMMNQLQSLDNHYRFEMRPDGRAQCFVQWPSLVTDQKALNAALRSYRVNSYSLEARQAVLQRIEKLRARLACKLGKAECRKPTSLPS